MQIAQSRVFGMCLIVIASFCFSLQVPLRIFGTANGMTSIQLIYLATIVASLIMVPFVPAALRNRPPVIGVVILAAAKGVAVCGYFLALQTLPPSLAVMFFFSAPLMVLLQTTVLKLEKLRVRQAVAFCIGISGLVLALNVEFQIEPIGIVWALIGGFGISWEYLSIRIWVSSAKHVTSATVLSTAGSNIITIPLALYLGSYSLPQVGTDWYFVVLLAVFALIIPTVLLLKGIPVAGANTASLLALSEPVFTIATAILLGWDNPAFHTLLGLALLLTALVIIVRK